MILILPSSLVAKRLGGLLRVLVEGVLIQCPPFLVGNVMWNRRAIFRFTLSPS